MLKSIEAMSPGKRLSPWLKDAGLSRWHWAHLSDTDRPELIVIGKTIFVLESPQDWFRRLAAQQKNQPKRLPGKPGSGRKKRAFPNN